MEQKTPQDVAQKISNARGNAHDPKMYPGIDALLIQNPGRLYAFPIIGGLVKIIILIPQYFILMILSMVVSIITVYLNSFAVLFTGRYMQIAYDLNLLYMKWYLKTTFFVSGLTDKYPGFYSEIRDTYSITVQKPQNSKRFFAIPVIGYMARYILIIPFSIWAAAVAYGSGYALLVNSFYVLFTGKYSETTFELIQDSTRLALAQHMYFNGLSDTYPAFRISMNHKYKKVFLILTGLVGYILIMIVWLVLQLMSSSLSGKEIPLK